MSRRSAVFAAAFLLFVVALARAQQPGTGKPEKFTVLDLKPEKFSILDLKFVVVDIGGKVRDLQVNETNTEIRIELAADVLFDFDRTDIKPQAQPALKQAASFVRDKAKGTVQIEGHTDGKGTDAYNQRLSEGRAAAVKNWFVSKEGLANVAFTTHGFGAKKPVAPNTKPDGSDDPDGRQKNRRVEIIVKK